MAFTASPAHLPMELDSSMDCITVSGYGSQTPSEASDASQEDSIMQSIEDTEDQHSFEASWSPSRDNADHGLSLRGGIKKDRYRPPSNDLMHDDSDDEMDFGKNDKIDYEDLKEYKKKEEADDDGESVSSDWDSYGDMPTTSVEYRMTIARIEGSEEWNDDQKKLHRLIYMRGLHPMMPSWWKFNFRMWGVTAGDLFTPKNSKKRVAIHAYGNELAATKALESLFYLSQIATTYQEVRLHDKISAFVVKTVRKYVDWSLQDADIAPAKALPNVLVQDFSLEFRGDGYYDSTESDLSSVPGDEGAVTAAAVRTNNTNGRDADDEEAMRRFMRAVTKVLEQKLRDVGRRWRALLWDDKKRRYIAEPPTLYAFAVVQHIVMIVSHDPSTSTNQIVVIDHIKLNDRGLWLWNALTIGLTINLARDALVALRDKGVKMPAPVKSGPDPDL